MRIAKRVGLGIAGAVLTVLGAAAGALADDPAQPADETLALEQSAVDPALLDAQSGTAPDAAAGDADLAGVSGAAGATSLDQPSFSSSQGSITAGAVSSSSLQATTAGGAVSVGQ